MNANRKESEGFAYGFEKGVAGFAFIRVHSRLISSFFGLPLSEQLAVGRLEFSSLTTAREVWKHAALKAMRPRSNIM